VHGTARAAAHPGERVAQQSSSPQVVPPRDIAMITSPAPLEPQPSAPLIARTVTAAPPPLAVKTRWHKPREALKAARSEPPNRKPSQLEATRLVPVAPAPAIAVIEAQQPRVRLIDEAEAHVRVVE
jgi:hypothetical protein